MIVSDQVPSLRNFRIVFTDEIFFFVSVIIFPFVSIHVSNIA